MNTNPLGHHANGQRALAPGNGNVSAKLGNGLSQAGRQD